VREMKESFRVIGEYSLEVGVRICDDLDSLILIAHLLNQEMRMFIDGFGFYWCVRGVDNVKEAAMSLP